MKLVLHLGNVKDNIQTENKQNSIKKISYSDKFFNDNKTT